MRKVLSRLVKEIPLKKFTKVSNQITFVSESIGCENVEIIRITRGAKAEFGLRFKKNALVKDLLS